MAHQKVCKQGRGDIKMKVNLFFALEYNSTESMINK